MNLDKYDGIYRIRIPKEKLELYEKIIEENRGESTYLIAYRLLCEEYPEEKERLNAKTILDTHTA